MSGWLGLSFVLLVLMGLPVSIAIGIAAIIAALIVNPGLLTAFPSMMYGALDSFLLVAIPLFMITGFIMEKGGTSQRIFDFAESLVGWMRGGLGAVNVVGSLIFGGISGSSVADAAGLGPIEINAMVKRGYPLEYSAALTLASSTFSVVIPPSILMVIYAINANQSVGACLVAGLLPGLLMGLVMILFNYFISRKNNWGASVPFSVRNIMNQGKKSFWAILTPVLLLAGVLSGYFTPTEVAGAAVVYTIFISIVIYKELKVKDLFKLFREVAAGGTATIFIICTAALAAYILTVDKIPMLVAEFIITHLQYPWLILLAINIFLLIVGMFMDTVCSIIILTPILLPVVQGIGMNPIHFGVVMVANLAIGLITPPVGACLYVTCGVAKVSMERLIKASIPFLLSLVISVLIITYCEPLVMFVPNLFGFN